MTLEEKYERELIEGLPIDFKGLLVYPLRVKDWWRLDSAKKAITIMMQRLPPELARLPYLFLLAALDCDELPYRNALASLLAMVLRLGNDAEQKMILMPYPEKKTAALIVKQGNEPIAISALEFTRLRRIIALQNKIRLPDEQGNLEILDAQTEDGAAGDLALETGRAKLIYALAESNHMSISEVMEMTLYEFESRIDARRVLEMFRLYTGGELSGIVSFKSGNPYPSWCFPKRQNEMYGLVPLSSLASKVGGATEISGQTKGE